MSKKPKVSRSCRPAPAKTPKRTLIGFFKAPPPDASPEAMDAWTNSIVDEMHRVDKEDAAAERAAKQTKAKVGK